MHSCLAALAATRPLGRPPHSSGDAQADLLLSAAAREVRDEARRLREASGHAEAGAELTPLFSELRGALDWEQGGGLPFLAVPPLSTTALPVRTGALKIGLGSPSTLGCMGVDGRSIRWGVLLDPTTGVLNAMNALGLAMVGLPGARLSAEVELPREVARQFGMQARGGPSYASTAVVWDKAAIPVASVDSEVGSARRLWMRCHTSSGALHVACVYMPPLPSQGPDVEWHAEMDGLDADIVAIRSSHGQGSRIFVMGDFNVEPAELGGEAGGHRARPGRWTLSYQRWGLVLLNPRIQGASITVPLPVRRRAVVVNPAHTHHCRGRPRALDLMLSSPGLSLPARVHNGHHCSSCSLQLCQEYTLGDHFLMDAQLSVDASPAVHAMGPLRMPRWWLAADAWVQGLDAARPCFSRLSGLLRDGASPDSLRRLPLGPAQ